jgi:hypothetical protein
VLKVPQEILEHVDLKEVRVLKVLKARQVHKGL